MDKKELLAALPPYEDHWVLIHPEQTVKDIVKEVLEAHDEFAPYYDKIVLFFDAGTTEQVCNRLYKFCKENIKYKEESEDRQTSALPTGLLVRGYGDCKHFSGFIGGVLDALNRSGRKIKWKYRFASYNVLDSMPHHVFIVVEDEGKEIWIDPTPNADVLTPSWKVDKKIKAKNMALHRNIAGLEVRENGIMVVGNAIGRTIDVNTINVDNINFDGTGKYAGVFNPYLGLNGYVEYDSSSGTDWNIVASKINQLIASGPQPGHAVEANFVKWVFDNNIRSWNFYYNGGVRPGFTAANLLPATWPRLIITNDGRLTFDRDIKLDDYRNAEIHLLTAWAQNLINTYDPSPYPVRPTHLKEFSQLKYGNVDTRNLFTERRGTSVFTDIGQALENALQFVKDGFLAVVGFIPRNAFLSLVGLNVFHMADHLAQSIANGEGDAIKSTWQGLGGDYDKLLNTIQKGAGKPAIEDTSTVTSETIGEATVAAILAAAAPIIAAMLKFLNKDGKMNPYIQSLQSALQTQFPDQDFSFLNGTLVDKTGQPVTFVAGTGGVSTWIKNNPLTAAGIALIFWETIGPKKYRLINKK